MSKIPTVPVVLELAPLPREQVGPFLVLGVDKTADKAAVEENWADRLKWARGQLIKVSLEDINWAREVLGDKDKRIRADVASLNLDTTDGVLLALSERFGGNAPAGALHCRPLDVEKDLHNYVPPVEMPSVEAVKAGIVVPDVPEEVPAAMGILEKFLRQPLDPWNLPVSWETVQPEPQAAEELSA